MQVSEGSKNKELLIILLTNINIGGGKFDSRLYQCCGKEIIDGLGDINNLLQQTAAEFEKLDNKEALTLRTNLNLIISQGSNVQAKADKAMAYLKQATPVFIKKTRNGALKQRLEEKGLIFD